jgi:DNA modification methylase
MYYEDSHIKVYNKSCTDMSELEDNSIQCCVTSPPYWGLRKYDDNQDIPGWGCSYGLEPTHELYVSHSIEILREIKRVLRKDGVVFWNIGDSYSGSGQGKGSNHGKSVFTDNDISVPDWKQTTTKPKDLCLIPFRVAIAAQEDGWWIRSVIIWNKPNPMPESVRDRPTDAYEHILDRKSTRLNSSH